MSEAKNAGRRSIRGMGLRAKIVLTFGIVVAVLAVQLVLVSVFNLVLSRAIADVFNIVDARYHIQRIIDDVDKIADTSEPILVAATGGGAEAQAGDSDLLRVHWEHLEQAADALRERALSIGVQAGLWAEFTVALAAADNSWDAYRAAVASGAPSAADELEVFNVELAGAEDILGLIDVDLRTRYRQAVLQEKIIHHLPLVGTVASGVLSLVLIALVAAVFTRQTLGPLQSLLSTVRRVSEEEDYAVRAERPSTREFGELVDGFNTMLGHIQARDAELLRNRDNLEDEVARRTAEIVEINRELTEAKERAEESSRAKSAFLANMSHELRTPLNAVIGYSEMLIEDAEDLGHEELVPDLEKIPTAGKQLLGLINDVLDISKIEAGKIELYLERFPVAQVIDEVVSTIRPLVDANANRLEVDLDPGAGVLRADLTKVRQVLFNLLSNACKFTENGTLTVRAKRERGGGGGGEGGDGEWIVFAVEDTGIGIDPEKVANLFQPFTQADANTTRKYGGTGLGLAISQRFCQMMGGAIELESRLGEGSIFTVRIPAVVEVEGAACAPDEEEKGAAPALLDGAAAPGDAPRPGAEEITVLVIDDDPEACELLRRMLTKEGFKVVEARSTEEGLRVAREVHPDVITLDVIMPGRDGWSALWRIKAEPELDDIPVLMVTFTDQKEMAYALGATGYLIKPVDRDKLISLIGQVTGSRTGTSLLVIDDDPSTREIIRRLFRSAGWSVVEAENGHEGLARLRERVPDLILLDLMMPEMDGFAVAEALRTNAAWCKIPVVVLTAKDLTEEDRSRLRRSVVKIFQKGSFQREELVQQVRKTLGK